MIFENVSRGLFEKDKILYSFLITTSIKRNAKVIDEAVWNILLRGPSVFTNEEKAGILKNPDPVMLTTINWETLVSAELRSSG
jgi:dynein heavy chain, axonemal